MEGQVEGSSVLIGEVATVTGVSTKTLRFYEAVGLLPEPARTPAGYRDYRDDAVARVGFIRQAQASGLTLAHIGEVLAVRDDGRARCHHVAGLVEDRLAEVTARLQELEHTHGELLALRDRLGALDPADCREGDICAAVPVDSEHRPA